MIDDYAHTRDAPGRRKARAEGARHMMQAVRRCPGPNYYQVLRGIHQTFAPDVYLEIGVFDGASLKQARPPTRAIAIDPDPHLPDSGLPVTPDLFRMTSDEFFARHRPTAAPRVDLAFLDGLHLFEQALLDLLNLESSLTPTSIVAVHDCLPLCELTAARERQTLFWSGDVWKLIPCLRRFRPDLHLAVVHTAPTGLGLITGFGGTHATDAAAGAVRYREMVEAFIDLPFAEWETHGTDWCAVVENDESAVERYLSAQLRKT